MSNEISEIKLSLTTKGDDASKIVREFTIQIRERAPPVVVETSRTQSEPTLSDEGIHEGAPPVVAETRKAPPGSTSSGQGFVKEVEEVTRDFLGRGVDRVARINQLWEFFIENLKSGCVGIPSIHVTPFGVKRVTALLLALLKEEKEAEKIAAALAICCFLARGNIAMTLSLVDGGLASLLATIIRSRLNEPEVVGRGLWVIALMADKSVDAAKELIDKGFVLTLEKVMDEPYCYDHDIMWAASWACQALCDSGNKCVRSLVSRYSRLQERLENVKGMFSGNTCAHLQAKDALLELERFADDKCRGTKRALFEDDQEQETSKRANVEGPSE